MHEPDLIFLDEPTSGLDPMGRLMVRDVLRAERDRGATVFFNSHLLSEIEVTCDRVAFITILTSIDTVAGELSSGTIQAIATKPISRSQLLLGKFIGFAGMIIVYVAVTFGATVVVAHSVTGVLPQHPVRGLLLIIFECLVALSLTFMFGTWVSTLTNGIIVLGLQAVTFVGGWLEQVSGFSQSAHIVTLGIASSLLMPGESLWRRAAYEMQTPLAGSLSFSPFANVSIPSMTAVIYAGVYFSVVLSVALYRFQERDLRIVAHRIVAPVHRIACTGATQANQAGFLGSVSCSAAASLASDFGDSCPTFPTIDPLRALTFTSSMPDLRSVFMSNE